jgi:replication initiator protein
MKKLIPGEEKLADRALTVRHLSVVDRDELGFSTRLFVQCGLPHRDPAQRQNLNVWKRANGNFSLRIQPGWDETDGKEVCIGYPYGNIPRLLLLYICTQAIQTKEKKVLLGDSLAEFMRKVGLGRTGGPQGTITRFKDQTWRLFNASISFDYQDEHGLASRKANIANQIQLWWNPKYPAQSSLFENYIVLTNEFFNEVMTYPVPIDMGIVSAIKQSPLALDLYTWLTYRVISLSTPTRISWISLSEQMGSEYSSLKNFARYAKEALVKIHTCWPELKIDEVKGGIIVRPSKPSVPFKL